MVISWIRSCCFVASESDLVIQDILESLVSINCFILLFWEVYRYIWEMDAGGEEIKVLWRINGNNFAEEVHSLPREHNPVEFYDDWEEILEERNNSPVRIRIRVDFF